MTDKSKNEKVNASHEKQGKMYKSLASPEVSDLIGQRLRSFYDNISQQPVPDRFIDLLKHLESASSPKKET